MPDLCGGVQPMQSHQIGFVHLHAQFEQLVHVVFDHSCRLPPVILQNLAANAAGVQNTDIDHRRAAMVQNGLHMIGSAKMDCLTRL